MRLLGLWLSLFVATPAAAQHWTRSWAAAPSGAGDAVAHAPLPALADRTLRQVVRVSIGGAKLRVLLSNEESAMRLPALGISLYLATDAHGEGNGAIDFDRAVRGPADLSRMAAAYDSGDHLHPNDAGMAAMAAMAATVDVGRLK